MPRCALCREDRPLRESHIIPAFFFRWLRNTSGGGFLRSPDDPNRRVQDGVKLPLLCEGCEQSISRSERWFKATVFDPYINEHARRIEYGPELFRFLVSLHWRYLAAVAEHGRDHPEADAAEYARHRPALAAAEKEWRGYLATGSAPHRYDRIHLFFTNIGGIRRTGLPPIPTFNRYIARDADTTIGVGHGDCFVYVKFARFMSWAEVTPMEFDSTDGTRISPTGGVLELPVRMTNGNFGAFVAQRAVKLRAMLDRMSAAQRQKVRAEIEKVASRLLGSDAEEAMRADVLATARHQSEALPARRKKIGRNEPCWCGSGRKYKQCHGK